MMASNIETSIEVEATSTTVSIHHNVSVVNVVNMDGMVDRANDDKKSENTNFADEKLDNERAKMEAHSYKNENANAKMLPAADESKYSNSSSSSSETSTASDSPESNSSASETITTTARTIGFHEPSIPSYLHANYNLKPKGVGYPFAPKGGLHPIYISDYDKISGKDESNPINSLSGAEASIYNSPYADERLKMTQEERTTENQEYTQKLNDIRNTWGYWNFKDGYREKNGKERPVVDFANVDGGDGYNPLLGEIDKGSFPEGAWQTDKE